MAAAARHRRSRSIGQRANRPAVQRTHGAPVLWPNCGTDGTRGTRVSVIGLALFFFKYYFSIKMLHYVQIELLMASLTDADGMREWKGIILLKYYSIILRKTGALVSLLGFGILPGPDNDRSPSKLPATTR